MTNKKYFVNENMRHNAEMQAKFLRNRDADEKALEIEESLFDLRFSNNKTDGKTFGLLKESAMAFQAFRQDRNNI